MALCALALPDVAIGARVWENTRDACPYVFSESGDWLSCVGGLATDEPLHLGLGRTVVPGDGSLGLVAQNTTSWGKQMIRMDARASQRRFWATGLTYGYADWNLEMDAHRRRLASLPYFGIGAQSSDVKSTFAADEVSFMTSSFLELTTEQVRFEGVIGYDQWKLSRTGTSPVQDHFTDATAPALAAQPRYVVYGVMAVWPTKQDGTHQFSWGSLDFVFDGTSANETLFEDVSGQDRSFLRTDVGLDGHVDFDHEGGVDNGTLSASARVKIAHASATSVPFYMQPSLGGADITGEESLRGFTYYRFRGTNAASARIEYVHSLPDQRYRPFVLFDIGQVALSTSELTRFGHLRHSVGIGLALYWDNREFARLYAAGAGGEGWQFIMRISEDFF